MKRMVALVAIKVDDNISSATVKELLETLLETIEEEPELSAKMAIKAVQVACEGDPDASALASLLRNALREFDEHALQTSESPSRSKH